MNPSAQFLTFEGGEGAGKSTLINRIKQELTERGLDVIKTREPGGTVLGDHIRRWLLNHEPGLHVSDRAELMLFLASRAQHVEEVIVPALEAGKIVLCDRFNDSTVSYQGYARRLGMGPVRELCAMACGGLVPNLTFFLDIETQVGLSRTTLADKDEAVSGDQDRIEAERFEFHDRVRQGFHLIAKEEPDRFRLIDASQSADAVFTEALKALESRLMR